jgi:hypothetical protein
VIEPSFVFWSRSRKQVEGGRAVAEEFSYSSDRNAWFLSVPEIQDLVATA